MAQENEMQEFTRSFFRGRPDLSTLTHSIVRRKFLAQVGRNHLKPEEKQVLKRLVEEELLKMQVDEAGSREEKLDLTKKVKRPPTPCSDPDSKRFRFNSESESSSAASSPDSFGPPTKNGTAAAEVSPAKEEKGPSQALKKVVESSDEEQQGDLTANMGIENSEEEEGSVRTSKVWKEGSSEEDEKKEYKGRTRKKPGIKNKQASGKASARKKQAREEREDSEEEPVQRIAKKAGGNRGAPSHQENEKESEEEEIVAKKESREEKEVEEEEWKPGARGNGGERSAWEGRSCKQKSRAGRQTKDWEDSGDEKEAVDSGEDSGEDEEPLVHWKSKDRTQCKGGQSQSGSNEDGEDRGKVQSPAQLGSVNGEESDLEREVSDSEAGESPKGERKNRSSKKSSKKGRTRNSSSSSDGSPDPKGRKATSGRRGEDHPAVMRLKRYIRACGAHRNYKKLLGSCHSHKERLSVLRAELEALGMKGEAVRALGGTRGSGCRGERDTSFFCPR
ncbi:Hypothetical predicted protein [Marmota monax]|uniref:Histone chaperone domain-containing protein n=1 Tax=Marmota monax TaxID=9995 RepID=A0A5E4C7D4_MARMO|nr:Hypothetical predicted protein [Marmota monax]